MRHRGTASIRDHECDKQELSVMAENDEEKLKVLLNHGIEHK